MKKSSTLSKKSVNENAFTDFISEIKQDFLSIGAEIKNDLNGILDESKEDGKQIQKEAQEIIDSAVAKLDELKKSYERTKN